MNDLRIMKKMVLGSTKEPDTGNYLGSISGGHGKLSSLASEVQMNTHIAMSVFESKGEAEDSITYGAF